MFHIDEPESSGLSVQSRQTRRSLSSATRRLALLSLFVAMTGAPGMLGASPPKRDMPATDVPVAEDLAEEQAVRARLMERAGREGRVRVIVQLAMPYQLEEKLPPQARDRQREAIALRSGRLAERVLRTPAGARLKTFKTLPFMSMEVDQDELAALLADSGIASVTEDRLHAPALASSTQTIGATTQWQAGYDGTGRVVAVLDTGVRLDHPFLSGAIVSEACYSTNYALYSATSLCPGGVTASIAPGSGTDCSGATGCGHGTHVAGIVAGDGATMRGVAPGAGIIAINVFTKVSSSTYCGSSTPCALAFTSDIVSGLERTYLLRNSFNIAAVNMSLGGGSYASACDANDPSTATAIGNLRAAGIATVIASGNNGYTGSISSPACISSAISVGATNKTPPIGVASYSNSATILDLLAPGSSIYSSTIDGSYGFKSGTSMATPHVAGAFAVLRQRYPQETVDDLLERLRSSGLSITDTRNGIVRPLIDLEAAAGGAIVDYTLSVSTSGLGTVTSTPEGIDCGSLCSASYPPGTSVTLTASAAPGAMFIGWSGACSGSATTCSTVMNQSRNASAVFATTLSQGDTLDQLQAPQGSEQQYVLDVPAGASNLLISLAGGTGDADLYVRYASPPTLSAFDCAPYLAGNDESCSYATPTAGRYHIMLHAWSAYSGVTLTARYDAPSDGTPDDIVLTGTSVSGSARHTARRTITARDGYVITSTGDVSLRAGTAVYLQPGFRIDSGGRLQVSVQ